MDIDTYTEFYKTHQEIAEIKNLLEELIKGLEETEQEEETNNTEEESEDEEIKIESNIRKN